MSASERLERLEENYSWPAERLLRSALPEIIAVMKAAESVADEFVAKGLLEALDNLESKLGGKEQFYFK